MSKTIDLTGKRFGRLIAITRDTSTKTGKIKWLCKCDCGGKKVVMKEHLLDGHTQSCGCLKKERFKPKPKHGETHTRLYNIWSSMKSRCYNPNNKKDYKDYRWKRNKNL